jgi:hypothetical protein
MAQELAQVDPQKGERGEKPYRSETSLAFWTKKAGEVKRALPPFKDFGPGKSTLTKWWISVILGQKGGL